MEVLVGLIIALAFLVTINPLKDVPDSELTLFPDLPGTRLALRYDVKSFTLFQDQNIVKQQYDFSCGSAALATILNYYLGENITEQQVIQGLMTYGDAKAIEQRRAFSLLDMKQFVSVLGYEGAGFTAEMEDLMALDKPCIVPIELYGYKHFIVYRGVYGEHVFFADPYLGNISFSIKEFKEMWHKNIVFLITAGGNTLDVLLLKEEDLRLVEFDMTRSALTSHARSIILDNEHRFKESLGTSIYKQLGVD